MLGEQEGAVEIDRRRAPPVGERDAGDGPGRQVVDGVAHQDVEASVLAQRRGDRGFGGRLLGDVGRQRDRLPSPGAHVRDRADDAVVVDIDAHHRRRFAREPAADGAADPAAGAGHDRRLALQARHVPSSVSPNPGQGMILRGMRFGWSAMKVMPLAVSPRLISILACSMAAV